MFIISSRAAKGATTADFNSGKAVVGTGPYKLVKFVSAESLEVERNDKYWGGKPHWARVTEKVIARDPSRLAARGAGALRGARFQPRRLALRHRQGRQAPRLQPAQGSAREENAVARDQPRPDRETHHGRQRTTCGAATMDDELRQQKLERAIAFAMADQPLIPVFYPIFDFAARKELVVTRRAQRRFNALMVKAG